MKLCERQVCDAYVSTGASCVETCWIQMGRCDMIVQDRNPLEVCQPCPESGLCRVLSNDTLSFLSRCIQALMKNVRMMYDRVAAVQAVTEGVQLKLRDMRA